MVISQTFLESKQSTSAKKKPYRNLTNLEFATYYLFVNSAKISFIAFYFSGEKQLFHGFYAKPSKPRLSYLTFTRFELARIF